VVEETREKGLWDKGKEGKFDYRKGAMG